jgi:hypothetical protein
MHPDEKNITNCKIATVPWKTISLSYHVMPIMQRKEEVSMQQASKYRQHTI